MRHPASFESSRLTFEMMVKHKFLEGGDIWRRKRQDFISYLKAFLLAPVLRVEQNSEAIAAAHGHGSARAARM